MRTILAMFVASILVALDAEVLSWIIFTIAAMIALIIDVLYTDWYYIKNWDGKGKPNKRTP